MPDDASGHIAVGSIASALRADVLIGAVVLAVVFGVAAHRLGLLTRGGAVAAGGLAFSVMGLGGWAWAVPSFLFFVTSSTLSRLFQRRRSPAETITAKGSRRDAVQVLANGGVGWGLLLAHTMWPADVLYLGFLGAFAAAAADTWATELGTLARSWPLLVTTGRRVAPGTSGAVSGQGSLAAVLGAAVVALGAWPFLASAYGLHPARWAMVVLVGAGVAGSMVDSLVGATIQARYYDDEAGRETEHAASASRPNRLVRGWAWVDNDMVNGLATLAGAVAAMACFTGGDFAF